MTMPARFKRWFYLFAVALTQGIINTTMAGLWWAVTGKGQEPDPDEPFSSRIDRKLDHFKLWIAGALVLNLMPILAVSWWGGSTLAQVQAEIRILASSAPQTVTRAEFELMRQELLRRADQNATRIAELERRK